MRISDWSSDVCSSDLLLEFGVAVGGVFDFRRAIEGECGRHEDQHGPLALQALVGDFDELAIVERLRLERLDFGIDQRHQKVLLSRWWGSRDTILSPRTQF